MGNKEKSGGIGAAVLLVILIMGAAGEVKPERDYRPPGSEGKAKLEDYARQQEEQRETKCGELRAKFAAVGSGGEKLAKDRRFQDICNRDPDPDDFSKRRVWGGYVVTSGPGQGQFIRGGNSYTGSSLQTRWLMFKHDVALRVLMVRIEYDNFKISKVYPVLEDWAGYENSRAKGREGRRAAAKTKEWEDRRAEEWKRATAEGRPPADWAYARPEPSE